jgi:hypothetical protein
LRLYCAQRLGESAADFSFELQTANTVDRIFYRTVSGTTVTVHEVDNNTRATYAGWVQKYPNLSFTLRYVFKVTRCLLLGVPYVTLGTIFYPFQSGIFTRMEADVDQLILDLWATQKKQATDAEASARLGMTPLAIGPIANRSAVAVDDLAKAMAKVSITTPAPALPPTPAANEVASG